MARNPSRPIIRLIHKAAASKASVEDLKQGLEKHITDLNRDQVQKMVFVELDNDLDFARAVRATHLVGTVPEQWRERALLVLEPEGQNPLFPDFAALKAEDVSPLFPHLAFG